MGKLTYSTTYTVEEKIKIVEIAIDSFSGYITHICPALIEGIETVKKCSCDDLYTPKILNKNFSRICEIANSYFAKKPQLCDSSTYCIENFIFDDRSWFSFTLKQLRIKLLSIYLDELKNSLK